MYLLSRILIISFSQLPLLFISTGVIAPDTKVLDIKRAQFFGESAFSQFFIDSVKQASKDFLQRYTSKIIRYARIVQDLTCFTPTIVSLTFWNLKENQESFLIAQIRR